MNWSIFGSEIIKYEKHIEFHFIKFSSTYPLLTRISITVFFLHVFSVKYFIDALLWYKIIERQHWKVQGKLYSKQNTDNYDNHVNEKAEDQFAWFDEKDVCINKSCVCWFYYSSMFDDRCKYYYTLYIV